jgi:hypothetical protein
MPSWPWPWPEIGLFQGMLLVSETGPTGFFSGGESKAGDEGKQREKEIPLHA